MHMPVFCLLMANFEVLCAAGVTHFTYGGKFPNNPEHIPFGSNLSLVH